MRLLAIFHVAYFVVFVTLIYGWLANLYAVAVAFSDNAPITATLFIRMFGVLAAPLGAVLGYL